METTHSGMACAASPAAFIDPAERHPSNTAGPIAAPSPKASISSMPSSRTLPGANALLRANARVVPGTKAAQARAAGSGTPWPASKFPSVPARTPAPKAGNVVHPDRNTPHPATNAANPATVAESTGPAHTANPNPNRRAAKPRDPTGPAANTAAPIPQTSHRACIDRDTSSECKLPCDRAETKDERDTCGQ
jgi:hypothetical protein